MLIIIQLLANCEGPEWDSPAVGGGGPDLHMP